MCFSLDSYRKPTKALYIAIKAQYDFIARAHSNHQISKSQLCIFLRYFIFSLSYCSCSISFSSEYSEPDLPPRLMMKDVFSSVLLRLAANHSLKLGAVTSAVIKLLGILLAKVDQNFTRTFLHSLQALKLRNITFVVAVQSHKFVHIQCH